MEHSLFPRKRTLLGRTRGHHNERNAIRNKLLAAQAKEAKNGPHGHHHQYGEQRQTHRHGEIASGSTNNPDMIHVAGDEDRNNMEANDVSTGVSVSRTSRSCFNSTAGPTGTTRTVNRLSLREAVKIVLSANTNVMLASNSISKLYQFLAYHC